MCGEQCFTAVHETGIGKGCSIFFSSAYVTLPSTTGYKVLPGVWSTWPHNNRTNLYNSSCANGVRFTLVRYSVSSLREAHPNSTFSLAISVLEHYTANNVMSCFSA